PGLPVLVTEAHRAPPLQAGGGREVAEGQHFYGNRPAFTQSGAQLGYIHHDDVLAAGGVDDLFAGLSTAAALDQVQVVTDFVGSVDAHIDVPGALRRSEWNAERLGLSTALLAGRYSDESASLADELGDTFDEE